MSDTFINTSLSHILCEAIPTIKAVSIYKNNKLIIKYFSKQTILYTSVNMKKISIKDLPNFIIKKQKVLLPKLPLRDDSTFLVSIIENRLRFLNITLNKYNVDPIYRLINKIKQEKNFNNYLITLIHTMSLSDEDFLKQYYSFI